MSTSEAVGLEIAENVELAALTTFGVGGPASFFVRCPDLPSLVAALRFAGERRLPLFVLGGGSNLLVADRGFAGLVLKPTAGDIVVRGRGDEIHLEAAAGASWDAVVEAAIAAGGAGLEALSGIPGSAGAAPIQNIGAYGQELATHLDQVEALDRESLELLAIPAAECGFGYRQSRFKKDWAGRFLITRLFLRLPRRSRARADYAELARHLGIAVGEEAELPELRRAVLELRRGKSMLADPHDENGRSAGSFFLNPVVGKATAEEVLRRHRSRGGSRDMPSWPARQGEEDQVKLSAAWLIEEAGFPRGYGQGRAGLSTRHTLAIVNRGGASAADILALAREIRAGVAAAFAVKLECEPILLGFGPAETL